MYIDTVTKDELADILVNPVYCDECEEEKHISLDDVYTAYKVILQPDATEDEIRFPISKLLTHFLEQSCSFHNPYLKQQQIIVTCCDDDLDYIIDKEVNLLQYIEFKIFQITSNSPTSTFEMFCKKLNTNN